MVKCPRKCKIVYKKGFQNVLGYSDDEVPRGIMPSIIASSTDNLLSNQFLSGLTDINQKNFYGKDAIEKKGLLKINNFLHDLKNDIDVFELIGFLKYAFNKLKMDIEERSVVLVVSEGIKPQIKKKLEFDGIKQSDMKEIGSQGVVSEVLSGKRLLNITQIKKISEKFHVSPTVFI